MNKINKKIAMIVLLFSCYNFVSAKTLTYGHYDDFVSSKSAFEVIDDTVFSVDLNGAGISLIDSTVSGYCLYQVVTSLIRENHFVKINYPYAQDWYDAMDKKYPVAKLNKKLFVQCGTIVPKMLASWFSVFNKIFFPQEALIRINDLYRKKSSDRVLSQEEELFLLEQEFVLLHESGHIENDDSVGKLIAGGLFSSTVALFKVKERSPLVAVSMNLLLVKFLHSRYLERRADEFAYTNGDDKCLEGGISFFQSDLVDPLYNIENSKFSPYINVDSTVGTIAQGAASCVTVPAFYIGKTIGTMINSTDVTRWMYDAARGLSHPGAPARIHAVRQEQKRRFENK